MLSNYQFDKYLSAKKNEDGEEQLKLPLEQILLDAGVDFEKVSLALLSGRVGLAGAPLTTARAFGGGSKWRSKPRWRRRRSSRATSV